MAASTVAIAVSVGGGTFVDIFGDTERSDLDRGGMGDTNVGAGGRGLTLPFEDFLTLSGDGPF